MLKRRMARHQHKDDFSEELIMKDRFGAGGINVYKFKASQSNMMTTSMNKHKKISFIIQPLVKFNKGFSYKNSLASTDIRLIYLGNKIVQTYIRIAKKGDFRCNEHSGGLLKYIPKNEVPSKVVAVSRNIAKILNQKTSLSRAFAKSVDYQSADEANAKSQTCPAKREYRGLSASGSLFALDFITSNNGNIYLLEANTGPGLDWNLSIKENEIEAKKLMRIIIKEIARRINSLKSTSEKKVVVPTIDIPPIGGYQYPPNLLITTQTT
jgi:glutathione synthase/RimK-type ligase-like ATP-grasp enzyme